MAELKGLVTGFLEMGRGGGGKRGRMNKDNLVGEGGMNQNRLVGEGG